MAKINSIVRFLNKELKVKKIKDPWCKNGLQVKSSTEVKKIGLSVDACMDVFEKAKKLNCDLIIVHHGILKPKQKDTTGLIKKRMKFLKKNKISLYASHLPLDIHKKYGNNANILRMIGLEPKASFSEVGYLTYSKGRSIDSIAKELGKKLKTRFKIWRFGKKRVRKIAVNSGYGGPEVSLAIKKGVDLLIVGELGHGPYLRAKEGKLNVILGGHYKTETVGIKILGNILEREFDLKTVFIDNPTGM
ncbi:MAG: Nif3-like dinuclear metal center hexameric protein [Candidatus Aenigmatarchaeota archaeon]